MTRRRTAVVGAGVALALLTGACGGDGEGPLTEESLAEVLRDDFAMSSEQADCVATQAFARLTSDELEELGRRDSDDEVPVDLQRKLRAAVTPCAGAGG